MRAVRAKALRKLAALTGSADARKKYRAMKKIWVIKKVMPNLLGGTK